MFQVVGGSVEEALLSILPVVVGIVVVLTAFVFVVSYRKSKSADDEGALSDEDAIRRLQRVKRSRI